VGPFLLENKEMKIAIVGEMSIRQYDLMEKLKEIYPEVEFVELDKEPPQEPSFDIIVIFDEYSDFDNDSWKGIIVSPDKSKPYYRQKERW
jgi:hypothetical protein